MRGGGETVSHAASQLDHGGFAEQDGASFAQSEDHRSVVIEALIGENGSAPGGGISAYRQQIFRSVRNAMQRTTVFPGGDLLLCLPSLLARQILGQRGIGSQARAQLPAALQVALCQFHRRKFAGADALGEFADR